MNMDIDMEVSQSEFEGYDYCFEIKVFNNLVEIDHLRSELLRKQQNLDYNHPAWNDSEINYIIEDVGDINIDNDIMDENTRQYIAITISCETRNLSSIMESLTDNNFACEFYRYT